MKMQEMQETQVQGLGQEYPLEKEMTTHSGSHTWKIPGTEEHGWLLSAALKRIKHDSVTENAHIITMKNNDVIYQNH